MSISDRIRDFPPFGGNMVVLGADADQLLKEISKSSMGKTVRFVDCRVDLPDSAKLLKQLTTDVHPGGIVHVAARAILAPRLLEALLALRNQVNRRALYIVSTPAAHILAFVGENKRDTERIRDWASSIVLPAEHCSRWPRAFRQAVVLVHGICSK